MKGDKKKQEEKPKVRKCVCTHTLNRHRTPEQAEHMAIGGAVFNTQLHCQDCDCTEFREVTS